MAAKAVIRDVGRILGFPYPQVDELAKLIPAEVGITLPTIMDDPKSDLSKRYAIISAEPREEHFLFSKLVVE